MEPEPEVASLGWMWQTGRNGSAIGQASSASTPRPTALATVANLKGDRIKAKKCVQVQSLSSTCHTRVCACRGVWGRCCPSMVPAELN